MVSPRGPEYLALEALWNPIIVLQASQYRLRQRAALIFGHRFYLSRHRYEVLDSISDGRYFRHMTANDPAAGGADEESTYVNDAS